MWRKIAYYLYSLLQFGISVIVSIITSPTFFSRAGTSEEPIVDLAIRVAIYGGVYFGMYYFLNIFKPRKIVRTKESHPSE